jgi:hypothetical protein
MIFIIVLGVILFLIGIIMATIPEIRGTGIYLIIGGAVLALFAILGKRSLKQKKALLKNIADDPRLAGAKIFEPAGNLIAIAETGFIGLKNDKIKQGLKVVNISDINGFEIDINGNLQRNTGGAVAGAVLFGGIGALIGGQSKEMITKLSLLFKLNDFQTPVVEIPFIIFKTKKGSFEHQQALDQAKEVCSLLEILERKYKGNS